MSQYTCNKCQSVHTTENMVAYCAVCFNEMVRIRELEAERDALAEECGQYQIRLQRVVDGSKILREKLKIAEEALKPFAKWSGHRPDCCDNEMYVYNDGQRNVFYYSDCCNADRALSKIREER